MVSDDEIYMDLAKFKHDYVLESGAVEYASYSLYRAFG